MCEFENCVSLWLYKFRVTLYTGTCTKPELSGKFIACCAAQVPPPQPQSPLNPVYPVTEFLWGLRCKEKSTHLLHPSTACSSDYNTDILILEMHVHPSPLEAASHPLVTCARHCSLHLHSSGTTFPPQLDYDLQELVSRFLLHFSSSEHRL